MTTLTETMSVDANIHVYPVLAIDNFFYDPPALLVEEGSIILLL